MKTFGVRSLLLFCGAFVLLQAELLCAQIISASSTKMLDDTKVLIQGGKPKEAQGIIAQIPVSDPGYSRAQYYNALCFYAQTNKDAFLKVLESDAVKSAALSPEAAEELSFKEIDALFYVRRFEDIFPKIEKFKKEKAGSARLKAVGEYQIASLFERGLKKTVRASIIKTGAEFEQFRDGGLTDLREFLNKASAFGETNYSAVPKHVLRNDVWTARLILGQEAQIESEIASQSSDVKEQFGFLRLKLRQKLEPDKVDRNLQMATDFLNTFPATTNRNWVQFTMANISFPKGKELSLEAEQADKAGNTQLAAEKRSAASRYFAYQRAMLDRVADDSSGLAEHDLVDLREDLLYSYLLEKDYAALSHLTSSLAVQSQRGDINWLLATVYDAIAALKQSPDETEKPAAAFDTILTFGFSGKPDHDRLVITAAKWRVGIALGTDDLKTVKRIIAQVQDANCKDNLKKTFLKDYANWANISSSKQP